MPRILAEGHCLRASRSTEHTDKLGAGEACGTDDVAVSEVRHTAVTNSKNSVFKIAFIDQLPGVVGKE